MAAKNVRPWLRMWTAPRQTIRSIVQKNPKQGFIWLSVVYGFPALLHLAQSRSLGDVISLAAIFIGALLFSPLIGMLGITVSSALFYWTGKWLGGKAPFLHVRAAVSWSNIPNVATSAIWLLLMALFGRGLFVNAFIMAPMPGFLGFVACALCLLQLGLWIWSFVLFLKAFGEVQGFSAWKALVNVIMLIVLVLIVSWLAMLFVWWSMGMPQ